MTLVSSSRYVSILCCFSNHFFIFKITIHLFLALIRLPRKIPFSENVQPVKMPSNCDSIEDIEAIAMGHGETKIDKFSPQLKFATLKTVSLKACRKVFPMLLFRKSVICASNEVRKQSIYYGDSGG